VKVLFDTNVLIGAFLPEHKSNAACVVWLERLITTNLEVFVKVSLDVADYVAAIDRVTQYGLVSGAVFDAVIAQAGLKIGVDRIVTFNVRDFERLGDVVRQLIQVPEST
jgi:predicted nucleic acid-binding protein